MIDAFLALLGLAAAPLAGLAVSSWWIGRAIERRHPPQGRLVSGGEPTLHVVDLPASASHAPAILFLHGASGNLEDLRQPLRDGLEGRYRLLFVDRPGHGFSSRGREPMHRPADQAARIANYLDRCDVGRVVVVGFSWGAAVAAALGVLHPHKVAALVFLAPATHPWPGGVRWYYRLGARPVLGPLFGYILAPPVGLILIDDAIRSVFRPSSVPADYRRRAAAELALRPRQFIANCRDIAGLNDAVAHLSPRYREISVPAEIVTGDRDAVVAPAIHAQGLQRDIADARLTVLEGIGHMPHWNATSETIAAIERVARQARQTDLAVSE